MSKVGRKVGHKHSEETKKKIGLANRGLWIVFNCDDCGKENEEQRSHYKKKKRHFCNMKCYSSFRINKLPKEEQHAYKGGGMGYNEKKKREKARRKLNYEVQCGRISRMPCKECGLEKTQGHHEDYNKPLDVIWLCRDCHWNEHRENKDLLPKD